MTKLKDPSIPFYFGNYYTSTRKMTQAERGAYIDVLAMIFETGRLTHDEVITFCEGHNYPKVFEKLSIDEHGLYYNTRLDHEMIKKSRFKESRAKNLGIYYGKDPKTINGEKQKSGKKPGKPVPDGTSTPGESNIRKKKAPKAKVFKPPSVEEVAAYCNERKNEVDPIAFLNHYETVGWVYGKSRHPIKDWKKAVHTWEDRERKEKKEKGIERGQHPGQNFVSGKVPAKFKTE